MRHTALIVGYVLAALLFMGLVTVLLAIINVMHAWGFVGIVAAIFGVAALAIFLITIGSEREVPHA